MNKSGVIMPQQQFWRVFNNDQLKIIDNAAYEIVREVGAVIADEELLKMAGKMGSRSTWRRRL